MGSYGATISGPRGNAYITPCDIIKGLALGRRFEVKTRTGEIRRYDTFASAINQAMKEVGLKA